MFLNEFEFIDTIRYVNISLGIACMWTLWRARRERGWDWTRKMKSIWLTNFLFVYVVVQANLELIYRDVHPTVAAYVTTLIMINLLWYSYSPEGYTKSQPRYQK